MMDGGLTFFGCAMAGLVLGIMALCLVKVASDDYMDITIGKTEDDADEPDEHSQR